MSNFLEYFFNVKDAIEAKLQDVVSKDGSGQSINLVSNLVQMIRTMGFQKNGPETFGRSISVQTMNQQHNNANELVVWMNV